MSSEKKESLKPDAAPAPPSRSMILNFLQGCEKDDCKTDDGGKLPLRHPTDPEKLCTRRKMEKINESLLPKLGEVDIKYQVLASVNIPDLLKFNNVDKRLPVDLVEFELKDGVFQENQPYDGGDDPMIRLLLSERQKAKLEKSKLKDAELTSEQIFLWHERFLCAFHDHKILALPSIDLSKHGKHIAMMINQVNSGIIFNNTKSETPLDAYEDCQTINFTILLGITSVHSFDGGVQFIYVSEERKNY